MKRFALAVSLSGALFAAAVGAGTATAKKHHHKQKTKVTMKGWYVNILGQGSQNVRPGGTVSCPAGKHVYGLGLIFSYKNAKPTAMFTWTFRGPALNYSHSYSWGAKKGTYPGTPNGVNFGAQSTPRVGFAPGSYTGTISQGGKTLGKETLTIAPGC